MPIRNRPAQGVLGGNGTNQISMVFKELLIDLKASNQGINAFSLIGRLKEVKKFSNISDELREVLFQESIMFVEKASRTIRENKKEISMLTRQCQYNQDLISANNSDTSLSPKEARGIGQRSRAESRHRAESKNRSELIQNGAELAEMSKVKDWKTAFELSLTKINEQKLSITKLSKLCLGALNAIDKIESDVQIGKENTACIDNRNVSLHDTNGENNSLIDKESVHSDLSQLSIMINELKNTLQNLEKEVTSKPSTCDIEDKVKEVVNRTLSENKQKSVNAFEVNDIVNKAVKQQPLNDQLGKFLRFISFLKTM